ncbi:hypothetical protein VTL71DRAFT_9145 [Oculimacula yallundae]|uniref:Uncharacterized protein n=1 Tax=Oculimacula yallundae TaxID=86028 RepID=A0ABR4BTX5_9HELO
MPSVTEPILETKITTNKLPSLQLATKETKNLQDTQGIVSIIHHANVGLSFVVNHILDSNSKFLQTLPGATSYKYLSSQSDFILDDKRFLRSLNRGKSSLQKVCQLLQDERSNASFHCTARNQQHSAEEFPRVTIGGGAFVSNFIRPDGSDMKEVYTRMQFHYRNSVTSSQYFQAICGTVKPALLKGSQPERYNDVHISTGLCLFSKSVLSVSPGSKPPTANSSLPIIPRIPQDASLTMYELEIVTRLSSAIADVVGLMKSNSTSCEAFIRIHIDIPDFQYYWTACNLFEERLVSLSYVQSWIAAIDERRRQLAQIMDSLIRTMLTDRHLSDRKIIVETKTGVAGAVVKEQMAFGKVASLRDIISALRSRGDDAPLWREFLDHLDSHAQPSTETELSQLTYVFNVVKPALERKSIPENAQDTPRQRLLLQIDDATEWKIHKNVNLFLKTYPKKREDCDGDLPFVVGMFAMQRIFIAGPGRSDLYWDGPASSLCLSLGKKSIAPLDIIGDTYGHHIKERLRHFMLKSGLRMEVQ